VRTPDASHLTAALDPPPEELADRDGYKRDANQRECQVRQIGHRTVLPCMIHPAPGPLPPRRAHPVRPGISRRLAQPRASTAGRAPRVDDGPQPDSQQCAQRSEESGPWSNHCSWISRRSTAGEPAQGKADGEADCPLHRLMVVELTEPRKDPGEDQRNNSPATHGGASPGVRYQPCLAIASNSTTFFRMKRFPCMRTFVLSGRSLIAHPSEPSNSRKYFVAASANRV